MEYNTLSSKTNLNNIFPDLVNVLDKNDIANINSQKWKQVKVNHSITNEDTREKKKIFKDKLREQLKVDNTTVISGIYVYYKDNKCLYVGKSKNIINRLSDHYIESQGFLGGDWGKFFSEHSYDLSVYILQLDDEEPIKGEAIRIIIERLLLILLKPEFEKLHPSKK